MGEKFSIAVCLYEKDNPDLFKIAIRSILTQSLLPDEIVIVVDGPIPEVLRNHLNLFSPQVYEKRISLVIYRFEINQGHGLARRCAIDLASHELVAICDADDFNHPDRFEKQVAYLQAHADVSVVGGQMKEADFDSGKILHARTVPCCSREIQNYIKWRCPMNQMSVMFRKTDVIEVGGYMDFYHNEDYFLWIRLIKNGKKLVNLPSYLVTAYVSSDTYTRRGGLTYFKSESKIQLLMLRYGLTHWYNVVVNIIIRLCVQILTPSRIRKSLFSTIFRKQVR